jgi:hypothetical protein
MNGKLRHIKNFTPTPFYKKTQSFISNDPGDIVARPLDATIFENGYPAIGSWYVLQLGKEESVTALQHAFRTHFHSAGWFYVKLFAKCTLHSCYRLFLP